MLPLNIITTLISKDMNKKKIVKQPRELHKETAHATNGFR